MAFSAVLALSAGVTAVAQETFRNYGYENRFRDNWFVSGIVGVNALNLSPGDFDSPAALGIDASFGKWFSPTFGARVGWQGLKMKPNSVTYGYNYVHGDLMWELLNTFDCYDAARIWTFAPYVNVGMVLNTYEDTSVLMSRGFGAGVGFYNAFRVNNVASVVVDLRTTVLNGRSALLSGGKIMMTSAMAGLQLNLGRGDWSYDLPVGYAAIPNGGFWDGWFFNLSGGVNSVTSISSWNGRPALCGDISLGKWFSSYAGARLGVQGPAMYAEGGDVKYNFVYTHADLLWNWTNTFCKVNGCHLWTASPYLHLGVMCSLADMGPRFKSEFAAGAGLYNAFAMSENIDLVVDLRATLLNGRSVGCTGGMALQPSVLAGVAYNFDTRTLLYKSSGLLRSDAAMNTDRLSRSDAEINTDRLLRSKGAINTDRLSRSDAATQNNGFAGNWNAWFGGGVNMLSIAILNPHDLGWRPAFDAGVMKMFSPGFGARLGLQANSLATPGRTAGQSASTGKNRAWQFVHGDVLADLRGIFGGYDPDRIWSIDPYVSMGISIVHNNRVSIRPAAGAGLLNSWRLTDNLGAFIDVRGLILSERQFGSDGGYVLETSATAGLSFDLGKNFWDHNGDGTLLNGLWDNWFVQTTGGMSLLWDSRSHFNGRPAPSMELSLGKWFSPQWGSRLGLLYHGMSRDDGNTYDGAYIHGDVLWNLSNTLFGMKGDRVWSVSPYLHFGVIGGWNHFGSRYAKDFSTGAGLLNDIRIDDRVSFVVDFRSSAMFGRMTGKNGGFGLNGDVLMGLSYNLGEGGWKPLRRPDDERGPLAISTNLVDWADLATVNLSVEYAVSRHWSADIVYGYNGWSFRDGALKDKRRSVTVGMRYWPWYAYSGAWVRPFLGAESSDAAGMPLGFMNGTCDRLGAGLSAGYSLMLSRHINLDFGLGFWAGALNHFASSAYSSSWGAFIAPKDIRFSLVYVL